MLELEVNFPYRICLKAGEEGAQDFICAVFELSSLLTAYHAC